MVSAPFLQIDANPRWYSSLLRYSYHLRGCSVSLSQLLALHCKDN
nr:MAG TPA: hypothetical protein [Caudoviricetes sp.]